MVSRESLGPKIGFQNYNFLRKFPETSASHFLTPLQMEDEVLSDVGGEDPYYPETERTYVTTTRSGRSVYTPKRLVVEE